MVASIPRRCLERVLLALFFLVVTESFSPPSLEWMKPSLSGRGATSRVHPLGTPRPARSVYTSRSVRKLPLQCASKHDESIEKFARGQFPTSKFVSSEAENLAQVLSAFWNSVVEVMDAEPGASVALGFPRCKVLENPLVVNRFMGHLEVCRDSCDDFGSRVVMQMHNVDLDVPPLFLIRSSAVQAKEDGEFDDDDDDEWGNDAAWGDSILDKYKHLLDDEDETEEEWEFRQLTEVPEDDMEVVASIREWVDIVVSDMGICPFSQSADKAGLPLGPVHYPISRVQRPEEAYAKYWDEVNYLITRDEKDISTTLLILPNFGISNVEGFTAFTDTLTSPLEPLGIEKYIQLVFFHPQWVFRDGQDRMGAEGAANFARRSPFPMINILRTPQVRLAQKSIPTGLVYTQNEETLMEIGNEALQEMLIQRDWSELKDERVDRRYNKLGKIAQMLIDADGVPAAEVKERLDAQIKELEEAKAAREGKTPPKQPPPETTEEEAGGMRF